MKRVNVNMKKYLICNFVVDNIEIAGTNIDSKSLLAFRCKEICMW